MPCGRQHAQGVGHPARSRNLRSQRYMGRVRSRHESASDERALAKACRLNGARPPLSIYALID